MKLLFFFLLTLVGVLFAVDPCANCTLVPIMPDGNVNGCGNLPASTKASAMLRTSDGTSCYLHVTGCDLWNFVVGGVCFLDNLNVRILTCINGQFNIQNPDNSFSPVTSLRCI